MASPTDLVPERYEVIKLKNGSEVVGMTRDLGDKIEITLPMIAASLQKKARVYR